MDKRSYRVASEQLEIKTGGRGESRGNSAASYRFHECKLSVQYSIIVVIMFVKIVYNNL